MRFLRYALLGLLALAALMVGDAPAGEAAPDATITVNSTADVFVSSIVDGSIYRVHPATGDTQLVATLGFPAEDMVLDSNGILYVGGVTTGVKRIDTKTNTILSDVGTNICGPEGLSIDSGGNVYANTRKSPCEHSGVWRIDGGTAETAIQVVPPFTSWGEGTAFLTHPPYQGHLISAAANASIFGDRVVRSSPDDLASNNPSTTFIGGFFHLSVPVGLAVNSAGEVFVADRGNGLIRRYAPDGTFLGNFASVAEPLFMEFDTADNLYVAETVADNLLKFAPDGTLTVLTNVHGIGGVAAAPAPPPPEPPRRVVLFIQGIASESLCTDDPDDDNTLPDGFIERVEWMQSFLNGDEGKLYRDYAGMSTDDRFDFRYYSYGTGTFAGRRCADGTTPDYIKPETCWSLDDLPRDGQDLDGQAMKLARFITDIIDEEGDEKIDIVAHSQGAGLSIYTALKGQGFDVRKLHSIVTLDGVVGGIGTNLPGGFVGAFVARELSLHLWNCPAVTRPHPFLPFVTVTDPDPRFDSPYDMLADSAVMKCNRLKEGCSRPETWRLYNADAAPGFFAVTGLAIVENVGWAAAAIDVGANTHSNIWEGDTTCRPRLLTGCLMPGSSEERELMRLKQFIGCAIAELVEPCDKYVNSESFLVRAGETISSVLRDAPLGTGIMVVHPQWCCSTVTTTLISPSGRVIDANTIALDVLHRSGDTFEMFEITNPEPGEWTVELFGADVPPEREDVFLNFVAVPGPSVDGDGDLVFDDADNCPGFFNATQVDNDADGLGDACDDDNDNDGVLNSDDNCEFVPNPGQEDVNENGIGDACDPDLNDFDGDSVLDGVDDCPLDPNPGQEDADSDSRGDVCDNCPAWPNADQANADGDQWGDACDNCPNVATAWFVPSGDDDCDGFTTDAENFMGTDPNDACAANNVAGNEGLPDAWPFDFNDDQKAAIGDVISFIPVFNSFSPNAPYDPRYDLNASGGITLADVMMYIPVFNMSCTP